MSDVIPLIRALEDCETDSERAAWLNTCPLSVFDHYEMQVRERFRQCGFAHGVRLLDIELATHRRERRITGRPTQEMQLLAGRGVMHAIALGLPARW